MSESGSPARRTGSLRTRALAIGAVALVASALSAVPAAGQDSEPSATPTTAAPTTAPTTAAPTTAPPTTAPPTTAAPTTAVASTVPATSSRDTSTASGGEPGAEPTTSTSSPTTPDEGSDTTDPTAPSTTDPNADTEGSTTTSLPPGCPAPESEGDPSVAATPTTAPAGVSEEVTFTTNEHGETVIIDGCTVVTVNPDDPGAFEERPEAVPETDATVPPRSRGAYANQPAFVPNEVIFSNVRDAQIKLDLALAEHVEAVATVKSLRLRLKELRADQAELSEETREVLDDLRAAETRLEFRALQAFVRGDAFSQFSGFDQDALLDAQVQHEMMEAVLEQDRIAIERFNELRDSLTTDDLMLYNRIRVVERSLDSAMDRVDLRLGAIEQAEVELEAFEAGSDVFIQDLQYPIAWPYDVPLIDSYGFPRATGTADEHWHEGIDLFAPYGTPLLAVERGVITRIGNGRLGGLTFWLRGESGTDWYYAHLSSFAPELEVGLVVEAGDVLGAVGTSGNARGTPPHLHLQMHPDGGRPLNPYPILAVRVEKDAVIRAESAAKAQPDERAPEPVPAPVAE